MIYFIRYWQHVFGLLLILTIAIVENILKWVFDMNTLFVIFAVCAIPVFSEIPALYPLIKLAHKK